MPIEGITFKNEETMKTETKLKLGRTAETLWLLSRGFYGRDIPDRLLRLAAIAETILEAYRDDPDGVSDTFEGFVEDFSRAVREYKKARGQGSGPDIEGAES